MKSTLSLNKSLSIEARAKIIQKPPENQNVEPPKKKKHPLISINWLAKTYSNCFDYKNPKPLKRGILEDILEQGLWTESKTALRNALSFYVASPLYHQAVLEEAFRYDLEGKKVEDIKESEREYSKRKIEKINNRQ